MAGKPSCRIVMSILRVATHDWKSPSHRKFAQLRLLSSLVNAICTFLLLFYGQFFQEQSKRPGRTPLVNANFLEVTVLSPAARTRVRWPLSDRREFA